MDLVIVESGAKGKTIQKYLGSEFYVDACEGHVQNLPSNPSPHKDTSKAKWNSKEGELPTPDWDWVYKGSGNRVRSSETKVKEILKKAKSEGVTKVYVATDPDREGEFIAWRLFEIFSGAGFKEIYRITFREITKTAVSSALEKPGSVDMNLVEGAIVRMLLDRLVGYRASKFCNSWGLASMGRVQTPTCGFLVERELEREKFEPVAYYSAKVNCQGVTFSVIFHDKNDSDVWKDGDGKINLERTFNADLAKNVVSALKTHGELNIIDVKEGRYSRNPKPAFETQTLIKTAGVTLGWSSGKVMATASELYNAGHTTYMRTDSTRTSPSARDAVRSYISQEWGDEYLGKGVVGKAGQNVQDAHEAIRPTSPEVRAPSGLSKDQSRLYQLIWARFAASQMTKSDYERRTLNCKVESVPQQLKGTLSWCVHLGWEVAFADVSGLPRTTEPDFDYSPGSKLVVDEEEENPKLIDDATKPPARYKEHSLIEEMKSHGIGRPSTWVNTINTLKRERTHRKKKIEPYCIVDDNGSLAPTDNGKLVWQTVVPFFESPEKTDDISLLFSHEFTADMELRLDLVETGQQTAGSVYHGFLEYFDKILKHAQAKKKEKPTAKQMSLLLRHFKLLDDKKVDEMLLGKTIDKIDGTLAGEILTELKEHTPAPTDGQIKFIKSLMEQLEMDETMVLEIVDLDTMDRLNINHARTLIDDLSSKLGPRKTSEKQLNYLISLVEKAELDEESACALVEVKKYDELTGGMSGTASQLIGMLREKLGIKGRGRRRRR